MTKIQKVCATLGVFGLIVGLSLATSQIVRAENLDSSGSSDSQASTADESPSTTSGSQTNAQKQPTKLIQQQKEATSKAAKLAAEQAKKRQENFMKACENRSKAFKTSFQGINNYVNKQVSMLDALSDRLEAYVAKQNLSVPNYDSLLAAVKTQRNLADTLSTTLEQKANNFTCSTDKATVQAAIQSYKDALQQRVTIVNAYKTVMKNLIAAIKSVVTGSIQEGKH